MSDQCGFCFGTGRYRGIFGHNDPLCPNCNGTGETYAMSDWQPIKTAPKDCFILLYCPEDESRWLAKWQGGEWYGIDCVHGITRSGYSQGDPNVVTGWAVSQWMPLPEPPSKG